MSNKKKGGGGGGHGAAWVVTFADLMALLMAFFVMIVSFSTQDTQKVAHAAGSIKDAFGIQPNPRRAGILERDGLPVRQFMKEMSSEPRKLDASYAAVKNDKFSKQGPEANTHDFERTDEEKPRQYLSAAASLRQALADMPEVAEVSKHVIFEETDDGLNIRIVDQEGRAMFPEGGKTPYEFMRQILLKLGPALARMPHRLRISGHTAGGSRWNGMDLSPWDVSSGRALAVEQILASAGVGYQKFESIIGRADTDPLYPNEPYLAANRRIDILLLHEAPPVPPNPLK
jgi:chemotaxis protein MotB